MDNELRLLINNQKKLTKLSNSFRIICAIFTIIISFFIGLDLVYNLNRINNETVDEFNVMPILLLFFSTIFLTFSILTLVYNIKLTKNTRSLNEIIKTSSLTSYEQLDHSWKKEFLQNYKIKAKKKTRNLIIIGISLFLLFVSLLIILITNNTFTQISNRSSGIIALYYILLVLSIISIISSIITFVLIPIYNSEPKEYEVNGHLLIKITGMFESIYYDVNKYVKVLKSNFTIPLSDNEELTYIGGAILPSKLLNEEYNENKNINS